jgi:hypothetical protein
MPITPNKKFPSSPAVNKASSFYMGGMAAWNVARLFTGASGVGEIGAWRPFQWFKGAPVSMIDKNDVVYVFDAVLRTNHATEIKATSHPIQSGANIVDHSYIEPEKLLLEIGMSDAMASFTPGQWKQYSTKSISAYKKLKELQYSRLPLTVKTRLNTYDNMIIIRIDSPEDSRTANGLRCTIYLQQIMVAQVSATTVKVSKRAQKTNKTALGTKQPKDDGSVLVRMGAKSS